MVDILYTSVYPAHSVCRSARAFFPELASDGAVYLVQTCPGAGGVFQLSLFDQQHSKSSVADRPKQAKKPLNAESPKDCIF
jgi:hypothetical protein